MWDFLSLGCWTPLVLLFWHNQKRSLEVGLNGTFYARTRFFVKHFSINA
jgi:hypothetical protein